MEAVADALVWLELGLVKVVVVVVLNPVIPVLLMVAFLIAYTVWDRHVWRDDETEVR